MALSKIQSNSYEDTAVHGQRNLIINGAMQVFQRATSATNPGGGYDTVDRFRSSQNNSGLGNYNAEQSTDAPSGFASSYKLTKSGVTSQTSTTSAFIQYFFEGQDVQQLQYGSSSAKKVTLSFYVKSSLTGTWGVALQDGEAGKHNVQTYTISSANTWEYKTITFDGDTAASIANDNSAELDVQFVLGAGSDYQTATTGSWQSGDKKTTSSQTQWPETDGATWQITGVQLEVGETATTFEHRSYADEFARCQRYFERIQTDGAGTPIGYCSVRTGSWYGGVPFLIEKRSAPSVTLNGSLFLAGIYGDISSQTPTGINEISKRGCRPYKTSGSYTAQGSFIAFQTPASHYIDADAEL